MYTILVTDDNELRVTTKERIMQRSKMVDSFHFLVKPMYKESIDMSSFNVTMEYKLPVSNEYAVQDITEDLVLTVDEEGNTVHYKDMLEYKLPFDTNLTAEAGEIEVQLTFTKSEMDAEGVVTQFVRKTSPCKITIVPIAAWSNIIPDKALTALDQRILKIDEQIQALLPVVEAESDSDDATINAANFKFTNVQLSEQSPLLGHSSASASLRNKYASLVVAIQRGEEYLKPNGEVIFQPQDIVWLVGDPKVISELK